MLTSSQFMSIMMCTSPFILLMIQRNHLLMTLLALEGIIITLIFFIFISSSASTTASFFYILILLTFSVCEASLGLALLVFMSRSYGSDFISLMTMNKC